MPVIAPPLAVVHWSAGSTPLLHTSTGLEVALVELFPSCASVFEPQHLSPPDVVTAQVCLLPAEMFATFVRALPAAVAHGAVAPTAQTSAGLLRAVLLPSPT